MVRQFEDLKATNEALKKTNEELVLKCTGLEQQLPEIHKEEKLEERVAFMSKQVLNKVTLKDDPKKVKYYTGFKPVFQDIFING